MAKLIEETLAYQEFYPGVVDCSPWLAAFATLDVDLSLGGKNS